MIWYIRPTTVSATTIWTVTIHRQVLILFLHRLRIREHLADTLHNKNRSRVWHSAPVFLYLKKHKKKTSEASRFFWNIQALSSFYLTWTQASWASVNVTRSAVYNSFNSLYIWLPSSVCSSVWVWYLDSESNALTADFAFCHYAAPPLPLKMQYYYSQY